MNTAFEHIDGQNKDVFIFGDHASRHIPAQMDNLGLSGDDLTRHIAWDIGTAQIIRHLCAAFSCAGLLCGTSRLVIDCHRDEAAPGLIPEASDGTDIPGNIGISAEESARRLKTYYHPYHTALSGALDRLAADPLIISVHSFTPKPKTGDFRLTEIGLLARHDMESAETLSGLFMQLGRNFTIGINTPYSAYDLNHTVDTHVAPRGFRHIVLEVRQDFVDAPGKAKDMADVLADRLQPLVRRVPKARLGLITP